jgi:hypothetical protein
LAASAALEMFVLPASNRVAAQAITMNAATTFVISTPMKTSSRSAFRSSGRSRLSTT